MRSGAAYVSLGSRPTARDTVLCVRTPHGHAAFAWQLKTRPRSLGLTKSRPRPSTAHLRGSRPHFWSLAAIVNGYLPRIRHGSLQNPSWIIIILTSFAKRSGGPIHYRVLWPFFGPPRPVDALRTRDTAEKDGTIGARPSVDALRACDVRHGDRLRCQAGSRKQARWPRAGHKKRTWWPLAVPGGPQAAAPNGPAPQTAPQKTTASGHHGRGPYSDIVAWSFSWSSSDGAPSMMTSPFSIT